MYGAECFTSSGGVKGFNIRVLAFHQYMMYIIKIIRANRAGRNRVSILGEGACVRKEVPYVTHKQWSESFDFPFYVLTEGGL